MIDPGANSKLFEEVIRELLGKGLSVRFQARGASMSPAIRDGEIVEITPVIVSKLRKDDIVLAKSNFGFRLHRIVFADPARDVFLTRGDCGQENDPALTGAQILGLAEAKEVRVGRKVVQARFRGVGGWALRCAAKSQQIADKALRCAARSSSMAKRTMARVGLLGLLLIFGTALLHAQVAVDATTSSSGEIPGAGSFTGGFNHTTGTGTNRLLLVGVSLNINNSTGSKITAVTYNGTALTQLGAHNDANNTRRVEMWYLLNPVSGTNVINVTVNVPTAATIGAVVGATTFTGVDQTVPLGTFVSRPTEPTEPTRSWMCRA